MHMNNESPHDRTFHFAMIQVLPAGVHDEEETQSARIAQREPGHLVLVARGGRRPPVAAREQVDGLADVQDMKPAPISGLGHEWDLKDVHRVVVERKVGHDAERRVVGGVVRSGPPSSDRSLHGRGESKNVLDVMFEFVETGWGGGGSGRRGRGRERESARRIAGHF